LKKAERLRILDEGQEEKLKEKNGIQKALKDKEAAIEEEK